MLDERTRRDLINLRNNLAHQNAEFWSKTDLLKSGIVFSRIEEYLSRTSNLIPILLPTEVAEDDDEISKARLRNALQVVDEFYKNRTVAEQELDEDEHLIVFVQIGKKEFRVKDLAVENETNKIVAFPDDASETAFVYCSPFKVKYKFYKEKNNL